ncbi:MAG: CNNM domain-containing protein [Cyclobacteriaceae bacterium]
MTLLIAFLLLSIVFSFLCSIWEAVLLSITPSYIKRKETESPAVGARLVKLKANIDKPLSAILTLNTIAHTVGAIGVGSQATAIFGATTISFFGINIAYESIIATLMTLAILFLSEIIPKTIGANNWKGLAPITAKCLNGLLIILSPFVWVSTQLTKVLKKDKSKSVFSKQDYMAMTEVIGESGELDDADYNLIKNTLSFDEVKAEEIMTPRTVVVMAEENKSLEDYYQEQKDFPFSRIPLYNDTQDSVTGVLLKDDFLVELVEGNGKKLLKDIKREVCFVDKGLSVRDAFTKLNEKQSHMAIVVDQYGALSGVLTMEDVFETLFGLEITDESDFTNDMQQYAKKIWSQRSKKLGISE